MANVDVDGKRAHSVEQKRCSHVNNENLMPKEGLWIVGPMGFPRQASKLVFFPRSGTPWEETEGIGVRNSI